jgi:hypothetical protein
MWRVASVGVVVVDLERSYLTKLLAEAALHTLARNRVTRHDGLVSVMRAWTHAELASLAQAAGLREAAVHRHGLFMNVLTAQKAERGVRSEAK